MSERTTDSSAGASGGQIRRIVSKVTRPAPPGLLDVRLMANTPALVRAPPSARAGASPLALPVCAPAPPLAPLPAPPRHPLRPPPLALARRECRRNP